MSAVKNKWSNLSSYLAVSKGLVENQLRNYVPFSLETGSWKFWSVKYIKIRKKVGIYFFEKVTYYSILYCKNYKFNTIC